MAAEKTRKTDRRTLYTKMAIKDSLLALLHGSSFDKLTVTAVCRQAEVTRATFYLHYDDLTSVLDELLDDALKLAEAEGRRPDEDMFEMLQLAAGRRRCKTVQHRYDCLLPVCQRVADAEKYRVLFLDESLSAHIVKRLFDVERDIMVPLLKEGCGLNGAEAEKLFQFVICGCFSVNKSMGWQKDEGWYDVQDVLVRFILGGVDALKAAGAPASERR